MINKIEQSVRQWVLAMMDSTTEALVSIHFDSISSELAGIQGMDMVMTACGILRAAKASISESPCEVPMKPLIFLPLGCSEELSLWDLAMWAQIGIDGEPPSLYLTSLEPFNVNDEEYRRPIEFLSDESFMEAIYRSFRSAAYMAKDWEFTNGIYLFMRGDL